MFSLVALITSNGTVPVHTHLSYLWWKNVSPSVCHEREVGENGDSYSCPSYVVWKLVSSSFRKCKFDHHGLPPTPLNFEFRGVWCEKIAVFRKFAAIHFWFWIWILHIRTQLENPYNFCAGCTLWVENWRNGITLKLSIFEQFRKMKCVDYSVSTMTLLYYYFYYYQRVYSWVCYYQ